jgi:hypothetical protein
MTKEDLYYFIKKNEVKQLIEVELIERLKNNTHK